MSVTRVKDLMKKNPVIVSPSATLKEAAEKMEAFACGALPVGTPDGLTGIITDRDIVVRAVAKGKDITQEKVHEHMTRKIHFIREDDAPDYAAVIMRENDINRLLVKDDSGRLTGILTFGRILRRNHNMNEITAVIECAVGIKAA